MPRSNTRKSAAGIGTIRKKTVTRNGKEYTFWEARYTVGFDPGTGKQVQRSISGKTQKEVRQKLQAATSSIAAGTYTAPCKMTLGEWLDIWKAEYLCGVKPLTIKDYNNHINAHIKPALGAVRLDGLEPHMIQRFYNTMSDKKEPLWQPRPLKMSTAFFIKHSNRQSPTAIFHRTPQRLVSYPKFKSRKSNRWSLMKSHPFSKKQIRTATAIYSPWQFSQECVRESF